ncbi:LysR family transcriptional regulator [Rhodovarius crocodyli]|uniref:LysR family transcriptional regulator n=1 Tax=Rhodovarius crocodyli TaxID=1979269 RepID=A0A437M201_9PROT|nr:LysR family transcriptional regulator [Rhodovarius crocodyli]RVT91721.1 LysR family transcriptional regulator [Rhodovarius crocodyli]
MDRFHEFLVFRRTVETSNVTRAAELLHVSQPAVSRTLANLEARLGVALLRRGKRGITVTEAGQALYGQIVGLLDGLDEMETGVSARRGQLSGSIRLTSSPIIFNELVVPLLARFSESHPEVAVECLLGSENYDLPAANIDLAVRGGRPGGQELVARKIGVAPIALYASDAYLARQGVPQALEELEGHRLVGSLFERDRGFWQLESETREGVALSLPVTVHHRADDLLGSMALMQAGQGIGLAPKYGAAKQGLRRVLPEWRAEGPPIFVVWPATRHMPARVRALADLLIAELPRLVRG